LQGSGKTTTAAKLARRLKLEQKAPGLVAADFRRPAAVEQLKQLGVQVGVPVFVPGAGCGSRRRRIANGAGRPVQEVNRLLEQFQQMRKLLQRM
jgi:signal recognition particle GTPase